MSDNILRVRVVSTGYAGGPGLNTHYFTQTSAAIPETTAMAQACVDGVRAAYNTGSNAFSRAITYSFNSDVDVINSLTGALVTTFGTTPPAAVAGTDTIGFGPLAAAMCIQLHTNGIVHNHRVRGRAFMSPAPGQSDEDGSPTALLLGNTRAFANSLLTPLAGGLVLAVWSRPVRVATPKVPIRAGSNFPVASVSVLDKFAVLRSRRD